MAVNPPTPGAYVPPHISASRNDPTIEMRYTKDQLLDLYKRQRDAGDLGSNLTDLYVGESDVVTNGNGSAKWGRRDEIDDLAAELCWERQGNTQILGILEMTEEEREVGSSVCMESELLLTSSPVVHELSKLSTKGTGSHSQGQLWASRGWVDSKILYISWTERIRVAIASYYAVRKSPSGKQRVLPVSERHQCIYVWRQHQGDSG